MPWQHVTVGGRHQGGRCPATGCIPAPGVGLQRLGARGSRRRALLSGAGSAPGKQGAVSRAGVNSIQPVPIVATIPLIQFQFNCFIFKMNINIIIMTYKALYSVLCSVQFDL